MKIYLDTNIVMDVLVGQSRENYPYEIKREYCGASARR